MSNNIKQLILKDDILEDKAEFVKENLNVALNHIRIICIGVLVFSIYYFYMDFVLLKNIDNHVFRQTLIYFHSLSFIMSLSFLLLYKTIKEKSDNISLLKFIYRSFVIILLLSGTLPTIMNQNYTGNIDAYIVIVLITAFGFPFELIFMVVSLILNHLLLMLGIYIFSTNYTVVLSKQTNSSAVLVAAILFCYSGYKHRVLDFYNKRRLKKSEFYFKELFQLNPLPLFITTYKSGKIIMFNDKAPDFYGYTKEEFSSISTMDLYINESDRHVLLKKLTITTKVNGFTVEQKCKDGNTKWIVANLELIKYFDMDCILTSVTDITEIKKIEDQLLNHASVDALTGILNRRTGMELSEQLLNSCKTKGVPLVVCFIDIDNLKFVNDNYGHNEGDALIYTICDVINNHISASDVFFRYGGDEFVILFPNKTEREVEAIWSEIKIKYEKLSTENQKSYNYMASHGLFELNNSNKYTLKEILQLSDERMYLEKKRRKS